MAVVSQQGTLQVTDPLSSNGWFGWVLSNISYSGNSSTVSAPTGVAVASDSDSNLYYAATVYENSLYIATYVMKISPTGSILWAKKFTLAQYTAAGILYVKKCIITNGATEELFIYGVFYTQVGGFGPTYSYREGLIHIDKSTGDVISTNKIWDGNSNSLSGPDAILLMDHTNFLGQNSFHGVIQSDNPSNRRTYFFELYYNTMSVIWQYEMYSTSSGIYKTYFLASYSSPGHSYYAGIPVISGTKDFTSGIIVDFPANPSGPGNQIAKQSVIQVAGVYQAIKLSSVVDESVGHSTLVGGSIYKIIDPGIGGAGPSEGFYARLNLVATGAGVVPNPVYFIWQKRITSITVGAYINIWDIKIDKLGRGFGVGEYKQSTSPDTARAALIFRFDVATGDIVWINKFEYYSRPGAVDGLGNPVITNTLFTQLSVADTYASPGGDPTYVYITGKTGYYPMIMKVPADGSLSYTAVDPVAYYLNSNPPPANFFPPQGEFSYDVFTDYTTGDPALATGSPPYTLTASSVSVYPEIQASTNFTFENFPSGWVYQTQNLIQK